MYEKIKAAVVGSINTDLILSMEKVPEAGESGICFPGGPDSGAEPGA